MSNLTYSKELPKYTKGEEIFNAVSHIVGGGFGVVALVIGLVVAAIHSNAYGVVSMAIYGSSMILLYTMSAIYHFLRPNKAKKVFRIFDHCTILRHHGAWVFRFACDLQPCRTSGSCHGLSAVCCRDSACDLRTDRNSALCMAQPCLSAPHATVDRCHKGGQKGKL